MSLSKEEIIRMAREAGWNESFNLKDEVSTRIFFASTDAVEALANAAYAVGAAAEREVCAKICDEKHDSWRWDDRPDQQYYFKVVTAKDVYKAMLDAAPEVKL